MVIWADNVVESGDMLICFDYGIDFRIWTLKDLQDKSSNGTKILNVGGAKTSEILGTIRWSGFFDANWKMDLSMATSLLHDVECEKWKVDVLNVPKLRTYVLFKNSYETEPYVSVLRNRRHRSLMAQFRCGILPLRVETGRLMSIPPEYRLCLFCDTPNTEDETHFLYHCKFYTDYRKDLFSYAESKIGDFRTLDTQTKFQILISTDIVKKQQNSYLIPWKSVEEHSIKPYNFSYDNLSKSL